METINILIDAVPQGRIRFEKGKGVIDTPKCFQFNKNFAALLKSFRRESMLYIGALRVSIDIYRKFETPMNQGYGDMDNLVKSILDACTGILWKDDSQIVDLRVRKFVTDENPNEEYVVLEWFAKQEEANNYVAKIVREINSN